MGKFHMSAQPQTKPATGTATVTVACKILSGFRCRIHEKKQFSIVGMGTTQTVEQYVEGEREFVLNGPAHAQNEGPRCVVSSGFALTHGVPKDFWDEWRRINTDLPAVRNGWIYAYETPDKVIDAAKERVGMKTGLERINPHNLPKINERFKLQTADENVSQIGNVELA
jgi:hypothetical protein